MINAFRSKLAGVICTACFFLAAGPAPAAQQTYKTIFGSMPEVMARLALAPVASVPATNILNLAIALPVRNQAGLELLQQQIYDPAGPNYHKYLTPAEFAGLFGATEQDCQAVAAFAQSHGLTVKEIHPNRLIIDVTGPVANIEAAFQVELKVYNHPTEARKFFAPATEPVVDASLPILHISGLEDYYLPRSQIISKHRGSLPEAGSAPGGGYSAADLRKAYVSDTKLTGVGQNVGLLQFDGFYPSDVAAYASSNGISSPPQVVTVPVDGGVTIPGSGNVEVAMDIEMTMALAPGVSTIFVYEAPNDTGLWVDLLSKMADDNLAKQLSCSWGGGPTNAAAEQIFQQMAVQGQSFYNAVGDTAAFIPIINPATFPSDSPHITQVGGTVLTTSSSGAYQTEQVWNTPDIPRENTFQGSSGGVSLNYAIPTWQQPISVAANHGSTTMRNMPDVALIADNIWIVFDDGVSGPDGGGTSSAAPLWAAYTALVNQQGTANGMAPIGFINPALYAIATNAANYAACFHDITIGANTNSLSPTNYFAVAGYDLCTGLGTPNGAALIYSLAGRPPRTGYLTLTVNPSPGSTLLNSSTQDVFVTVNDGGYDVTNATVTAVIPGVTNLMLLNNGQPPDVKSNDAIYSGAFTVPAGATALMMTVTASATNEIGATNVVYYSVVPLPPNDNFANATKVAAAGGKYFANNQFATLETNEPAHDGDSSDAGSLWWQWTPVVNTNVFINTIGSQVANVLAVYTGSTLLTLRSVAATNGIPVSFQPAYLNFNATAGVTYRIAVASASSNSLGSLVLQVAPGGQLDTTPPFVTVTSPLSGQTVTNQGVLLSGTAFDPGANASGLAQVMVSVNSVSTIATGTTNWTAAVALQPELNIITATAVDAAGNVSTPVTIEVNYLVSPVVNDFFVNAIPLPNETGGVSGNNNNATKEAGEPDIAGNPGGASVWWSFTPTADGVLTLNTTNSTFDTLLGLFTGPNVADLTPVAENDDAYPGAPGGFSYISQAVRSNETYDIAVDGYDGAFGNVSLAYSFVPATVYHVIVTNTAGGSVQLSVTNILGGITVLPGQSGDFAAGSAMTLSAIPFATAQFNNWSGAVSSTANPLTFVVQSNASLTANFGPIQYTDGFESGDLSHLSWTTSGSLPWFVQTNVVAQGLYAAQSGAITNSQVSSLLLTTNFNSGIGSFDFKVSSETNWDFLNFYVDGVLYKQWSGEVGWEKYTFALNAGAHTLEWSYAKDPSLSSGLDAAFIDDVNLPVGTPITPPPQLQLQHQGDGSLLMTLTGQGNGQYVIQTSTNLVAWQNFSTNTAAGGIIQITIPANPTNQAQFYRAFAP